MDTALGRPGRSPALSGGLLDEKDPLLSHLKESRDGTILGCFRSPRSGAVLLAKPMPTFKVLNRQREIGYLELPEWVLDTKAPQVPGFEGNDTGLAIVVELR